MTSIGKNYSSQGLHGHGRCFARSRHVQPEHRAHNAGPCPPRGAPSRPEPGPTPCQGPLTQSGGEGEKPGLFPELFQQSS